MSNGQSLTSSHFDGGQLGWPFCDPVVTPMTRMFAGTLPLARHSFNTGSSALQCGHQCARNTTSVALPSAPGVIDIGRPRRSKPDSAGAFLLAAGSGAPSGNLGNVSPVTETFWNSAGCTPPGTVVSVLLVVEPPPPPAVVPIATAPASPTTTMRMYMSDLRPPPSRDFFLLFCLR